MQINKRGYWENPTSEGHGVDPNLASGIVRFLKQFDYSYKLDYGLVKKPFINIVDVGCGTGYYTKYLIDSSISCDGYDGNPHTKEISNGYGHTLDFSSPIDPLKLFSMNYDWVLSLEVGEHIPVEYEQVFLNNLAYLATEGIILSWAIPGQAGDGHINCRENIYIIEQLRKRGFIFHDEDTIKLRNSASPYPQTGWWFKNTLLVFYKNKDS